MKEKVKNIRYSLVCLLLMTVIIACQNEKLPGDGPFDAAARIEATLGNINLDTEKTDTRADTYTRLADGETFRLYAFRRGETETSQIVVSYAYTMKNGKPVMNEGQGDGKLYLPYGNLDIYLAGPLDMDSEEAGVRLLIASPSGIIPRQGVDLIASCTPVTINYTGSNQVNPVPLKHKMAKVKMRVNRKLDYAHMKRLVLTKVELFNQHTGVGEYTFNSTDGGTIKPLLSDSVSGGSFVCEGNNIKVTTEGKDYYASFMLLPREAGYLRTEIEMQVTQQRPGEAERTDPYRMSGIIRNVPLVGGKHNLFLTEPVTSADIVWRPTLLPWNDQSPIDTPVGGDMVLYLDGRDAPELIDGKRCWRDRSGNGNHAEILSSNITYNKERKCYEFPTAKDLMQIPDLGLIPDYTLEILVENTQLTDLPLLTFSESSDRDLCLHIPSGTTVYFDSGKKENDGSSTNGRIQKQVSTDPIYYHTFRTYFFRKQSSGTRNMALGVNGIRLHTMDKQSIAATAHGAFKNNILGGIANFRIRSVRLYRKALTDVELKSNYESDNSIYKQDPEVVKNGLVLLLDGKVPPYIGIGNTYTIGDMYWPDMSGNIHHAKYMHKKVGLNFIYYNGNGYEFNNIGVNDRSYMELLGSLGTLQTYTLEIVFKSTRSYGSPFYSSASGDHNNRALGIHMPWSGSIYFDSPYYSAQPNLNRFSYTGPVSTVDYLSNFHYHAFQRVETTSPNATLSYYSDGVFIHSIDRSVSNVEMKNTVIGNGVIEATPSDWLQGEILTIRLYNRALTKNEILTNSRTDKARYGY